MCEADVYMADQDREELVMQAVDLVEPLDAHEWRLVNIFGEQKIIKAKMTRVTLGQHKLFFAPAD